MPFKWLQHDSNPPGLCYCGVTILGSAPPPTDTTMSVFLLPTLNGGKKKIVSTISDLRKSCSILTCRRCPYCSEKAWVILFGEKTRVGIRDVSGLMSGTVGTVVWRLCMETFAGGAAPGKQDATSLQWMLAGQGHITPQLRTTMDASKFYTLALRVKKCQRQCFKVSDGHLLPQSIVLILIPNLHFF